MSNEIHPAHQPANGGYEHRDVGTPGILYFLVGLAVAGILTYFVVVGFYSYLEKRSNAQQAPVSPLVTNAPVDTRHISPTYPQTAFPDPKLEEDERGQMYSIRLKEEETLSSYDWVDQKAGTVRIPIDRAMDLLTQRGLPVRTQAEGDKASAIQPSKTHSGKAQPETPKGSKK
jgi:hypothetical protein